MSGLWTQWEGQTVDGAYPLRRCLGFSDHSGVFLTEDSAQSSATVAVKLVPAIPTLAESQLSYWDVASCLSHPRLLSLFSTGRCQLSHLHCLYVVMEYAEQSLAQFLTTRSLTEAEVLELLPQTLAPLGFLHARHLVHGHLKPSNVLVAGDQLKLASDCIRPAGEATTRISMLSAYDPPEARDGSFSTAGDIWALGVTLYEALTGTTPVKPDERSHGVELPPDFPPSWAGLVRECLSRRPDDRPSVARLQAWVNRSAARSAATAAQIIGVASPGSLHPADPLAKEAAPLALAPGAKEPPVLEPAELFIFPELPVDTVVVEDLSNELKQPQGPLTLSAVAETKSPQQRRSLLPMAFAAVATIALGWGALRLFTGNTSAARPPLKVALAPEVASAPVLANSGATSLSPQESEPQSPASEVPGAAPDSAAPATPGEPAVPPAAGKPTTAPPTVGNAAAPPATGEPTVLAADGDAAAPAVTGKPAVPAAVGDEAATVTGKSAVPAAEGEASAPAVTSNPAAPVVERGPAMAAVVAKPTVPVSPEESAVPQRSADEDKGHPGSEADSMPVLHEEIPNVPRSALATIHGRIKVAVQVNVDASGAVVDQSLLTPGPSAYFARIATEAARKWKFTPASDSSRQSVLHFEFSRAGAKARVSASS